MLRYLYAKEVFREIPDEVSLGISISGCQILCPGCHSPELWKNKGRFLTWPAVKRLLEKHRGVTCLLLLGGEHGVRELMEIFFSARRYVRTAWYSGLTELSEEQKPILQFLDYIKLGPYRPALGGLDCPTTNQRLYKISNNGMENITWKLQ